MSKLRSLHHVEKSFDKINIKQSGNTTTETGTTAEKSPQSKSKQNTDDNNESDSEDDDEAYEDGEDETHEAVKIDDNNDENLQRFKDLTMMIADDELVKFAN